MTILFVRASAVAVAVVVVALAVAEVQALRQMDTTPPLTLGTT